MKPGTNAAAEEWNRQINELSHIFSLCDALFCVVGPDGFFKNITPSFINLLGYERNELLSHPIFEFLHPDDIQPTRQRLAELAQGADIRGFTNRYRKKNGDYCTLSWTSCKAGQGEYIYALAKDYETLTDLEKKLFNTSNELMAILDNIADGFFAMSKNWIIRYSNEQARKMVNLDAEQAAGKSLWDLFPEERDSVFYAHYEKALREHCKVRFEGWVQSLGLWLEVTAFPYGQGLFVFFRDITEKKKTQRLMQEVNERYRLVAKATSEVIWDWKVGENTLYWHGENLKVRLKHDIVNAVTPRSFWLDHIHPEDRAGVLGQLQQALEEGLDQCTLEYRFLQGGDGYIFVRDRSHIIRDEEGRPQRVVGAIEDISQQKMAEHALVESENNYRLLFNHAPLPQCIYDSQTLQVLDANDAAVRFYGYSRSELLAMTVLDIRPKEEINRFYQYLDEIAQKKVAEGIWTHVKKNGQRVVVEVSASLIEFRHRPCVLVTVNDLTDKLELEEKVSRLKVLRQRRITQATINGQEKEREQIGKELHDNINQVLTTTRLYLELARSNEELRDNLLERCEENLNETIREIRALSKSLIPPTLKDIGLAEALQELLDSFALIQKFALHFVHSGPLESLSEDLKLTLYRIVQEQLTNISKYAQARQVWVTLRVEKEIELSVKDDGVGFDPEAKRKGIGITNIKNRISLYNGQLFLRSHPGAGCHLAVVIPRDELENKEVASAVFDILIAEDNRDEQALLREAFQEVAPRHRVTFVESGDQLLGRLKSLPDEELPSLVVLDLRMPGMSGLEILKALETDQHLKRIPKIVYSNETQERFKKECYSANATAYIEKGFSLSEIKENVAQMISFCRPA